MRAPIQLKMVITVSLNMPWAMEPVKAPCLSLLIIRRDCLLGFHTYNLSCIQFFLLQIRVSFFCDSWFTRGLFLYEKPERSIQWFYQPLINMNLKRNTKWGYCWENIPRGWWWSCSHSDIHWYLPFSTFLEGVIVIDLCILR